MAPACACSIPSRRRQNAPIALVVRTEAPTPSRAASATPADQALRPHVASEKPPRLPFLDDLRGVAVVAMFVWHTTDAWLRSGLRAGDGYTSLRIFGGMAAPLFLMLAGAAAALKLSRTGSGLHAAGRARAQLAARGAGVICVGYGLRLSMWMIDGGVLGELWALPLWSTQLVGLFALWWATEELGRGRRRRAALTGLVGGLSWAAGLWLTSRAVPQRMPGLLRVDVLQSIGASLVLIAAAQPLLRFPRRAPALLVGALVLLATEPLRDVLPAGLPHPIAAYVGAWPTADGVRSMAMFPLAPWLGYALLGACFGAHLSKAGTRAELTRSMAVAVPVMALVGFLASGVLQLTTAAPFTAKLVRALHRTGIATSAAGLLMLLPSHRLSPLRVFGQTSLLLYCVHLEFAYGVAARPLAHRLGYGGWFVGLFLLSTSMYGVGRLRLRLGAFLRNRSLGIGRQKKTPHEVT